MFWFQLENRHFHILNTNARQIFDVIDYENMELPTNCKKKQIQNYQQ